MKTYIERHVNYCGHKLCFDVCSKISNWFLDRFLMR